jgi:hypothetical protein
MNIFGHLIPDSAILGIGPLMHEDSASQQELILYGKCRYYFELHLAAHTTPVKSDWFSPRDNKEEQEKMKAWKLKYNQLRTGISKMISPNGQSEEEYGKNIENVYKDLKSNLDILFEDFQLPEEERKNVRFDVRIARVYDDLSQLRHLTYQE